MYQENPTAPGAADRIPLPVKILQHPKPGPLAVGNAMPFGVVVSPLARNGLFAAAQATPLPATVRIPTTVAVVSADDDPVSVSNVDDDPARNANAETNPFHTHDLSV